MLKYSLNVLRYLIHLELYVIALKKAKAKQFIRKKVELSLVFVLSQTFSEPIFVVLG